MDIIKTPFDALCISIKREQEGFKKIDRKRIRYLMGLYSNVQSLEIGIDCSEFEKACVIDYVVGHLPNADECIWNDILNHEYDQLLSIS